MCIGKCKKMFNVKRTTNNEQGAAPLEFRIWVLKFESWVLVLVISTFLYC